MNLNSHNLSFHGIQNVVLTVDGLMIDSDNTIIDLSAMKGDSIYDKYPVTESAVEGLKEGAKKELYIPRVEMTLDHKEYIFDLHFKFIGEEDDKKVLWTIQDLSRVYRYLADVQQERNEAIVKYERLSRKLLNEDD